MKKIIYVYSNCSPNKYKNLVESSRIMVLQQAQKYHQMMLEGIVANGYEVTAVSCLPINRRLTKKIFFKRENDSYNNIKYIYLPFINMPILRSLSIFIFSLAYCMKRENIPVVCDVLNTSISTGALFGSRLTNKKVIGIVTDVPGDFFGRDSLKVVLAQKISRWILGKFDAYLFLTRQMNSLINKVCRPFTVIEGQVDVCMEKYENCLSGKYIKKVCIYAGSLKRIYGIDLLVKSFIRAEVEDSELHIYGDGDFAEELIKISDNNKYIRYHGVAPNERIVREQLKATLLINPRPTKDEYTKYSFPSKNMEYIASGTPVLTTKLPGMPKEYYEYVYLIENETVDGLSELLRYILTKPREELHEKGITAKNFAMREKNNIIQAKKLLNLIEDLNSCN